MVVGELPTNGRRWNSAGQNEVWHCAVTSTRAGRIYG